MRVACVSTLPAICRRCTTDAARLELILANLVANAIKYSDPDKPDRFVEVTRVPTPNAEMCALAIRDNGIGIAETRLAIHLWALLPWASRTRLGAWRQRIGIGLVDRR